MKMIILANWIALVSLICSHVDLIAQNELDSLLFEAVKQNDLKTVSSLIAMGANGNDIDTNNATVLMWAVYQGDLDLIKFLIQKGADISKKGVIYVDTIGNYYGNLIGIAAGEGKLEILKYLVEECKIPINDQAYSMYYKSYRGWSALHYSCWKENLDVIKYLIKNGININLQTQGGNSPLNIAILFNNKNAIECLLTAGADINLKDSTGCTPLKKAVQENDSLDIIELLIKHGANIDEPDNDGWTPLMNAVYNDESKIARLLLTYQANVNLKNSIGYTPIWYAVINKDTSIITELVPSGADINSNDSAGWTSIFPAIHSGDKEFVEFMIEKGSDINHQGGPGKRTPLMELITCKELFNDPDDYLELIKTFISLTKDIDVSDKGGLSALDYSVIFNQIFVTESLVLNGANVNKKDTAGTTPLMHAAGNNNREAVKMLLDYGADINSRNSLGSTALHYAAANIDAEKDGFDLEEYWNNTIKQLIDKGIKQK